MSIWKDDRYLAGSSYIDISWSQGGQVSCSIAAFSFFSIYYFRREVYDFHHAILGLLFSVLLTGVIMDSIKKTLLVGRDQISFGAVSQMERQITGDVVCHGNAKDIKEGYKSFPSGHTSYLQVVSVNFRDVVYCPVLLYFETGPLQVFLSFHGICQEKLEHLIVEAMLRNSALCFFPVLVAALMGVSRVDDYWHHWTDVFTGALICLSILQ
ncbi:hypothetical protein CRYUN_Cryun13aG0065100 [Craigia yunnanensis]